VGKYTHHLMLCTCAVDPLESVSHVSGLTDTGMRVWCVHDA
jgi:hypothetical protein